MHKGFLRTAAFAGALSVALGAFAAHGLKKIFPPDVLTIFETAVRYQFYHVFALIAVAIIYGSYPSALLKWSGYLFITGMIIFCGTLYVLCYVKYAGYPLEWIGAITPVGGVSLIAGWLLMFISMATRR